MGRRRMRGSTVLYRPLRTTAIVRPSGDQTGDKYV
jgi:hypothetical protein